MAELETGKVNPNPEPVKKPASPAADATKYVGTPAVGTSKAAASAGVAGTAPSTEIDRHRRRFVWTMVTGFLTAWFLAFFRFFLPRTIFEPHPLSSRLPVGFRSRSRHEIPAEISNLGGPNAERLVRDLRSLHASGLHSRLEAQREQIQMSVPRQRLQQRRNQLRRTGAASDGSRARRT